MGDNFDTNDKVNNQEQKPFAYQPENQQSNRQEQDYQTVSQQQVNQQPPGQPQGFRQTAGQPQGNQQANGQPHGYQQNTGQYQYRQPQYSGQSQGNIYQPYGHQYDYHQNIQPESKGLAIASMVLGIVSLCMACVYYISFPGAIVGLVLGLVSLKKKAGGREMAIAGIVTSIITISLILLFVLGLMSCIGYTSRIYGDIMNNIYY